MKKTKVLLTKNIEQILMLQHQVKEQFQKNAQLIQFLYEEKMNQRGSVASSRDQFAAALLEDDMLYPKIDEQILGRMTTQVQQFPTRKNLTAGGQ